MSSLIFLNFLFFNKVCNTYLIIVYIIYFIPKYFIFCIAYSICTLLNSVGNMNCSLINSTVIL